MSLRTRTLATAAGALLLLPASALAAEPAAGELTGAAPVTRWSGVAPAAVTNTARFFTDDTETFGCIAELGCDTYTLTLAERGKLEVTVTEDDGSGYTDVLIEQPDGTEFWSPGDVDVPTKFTRTNAPAGTYVVQVQTDDFGAGLGDGAYQALAELNDGKVVTPPAPAE